MNNPKGKPPKGILKSKTQSPEASVADTETDSPSPFDLRIIKQLVGLMGEHDLAEINLEEGDSRIRLRRGPQGIVAQAPMAAPPMMAPATALTPVAGDKPATIATSSKKYSEIKSPTPGTFYAAANPDSPPYVKVGSKVQPDTVVCLIEAMKVYNDIKAECSGTVVEILVQNQQPVEYDQVLFRVDPG